ncbi:putative GMC-type oxidoreductase [Methylobacterium brachiatum]|jgi:choline dehydrogenase|nr:putative GMC-type oxidoreductase [Methylobacterium brachiatum]
MWHPMGTCRVGVDDDAVVDPSLRVVGLRGLRVVDASIMPNIVSGNTIPPTMALASKEVEKIKFDLWGHRPAPVLAAEKVVA